MHRISKNELILASCSFVKHGLILIILDKQHQHTFRNYMLTCILLSLMFLHFDLFYLLFITRQHTDARYWYSNNVRLSVRLSVCP